MTRVVLVELEGGDFDVWCRHPNGDGGTRSVRAGVLQPDHTGHQRWICLGTDGERADVHIATGDFAYCIERLREHSSRLMLARERGRPGVLDEL